MFNVLWLQGASCGGCTIAALESGQSGWFEELRSFGIHLLWHPSVSEATGSELVAILDEARAGQISPDAVVLEQSVLRGPNGSGRFNVPAGTGRSIYQWMTELAAVAGYVVSVGSCAADKCSVGYKLTVRELADA